MPGQLSFAIFFPLSLSLALFFSSLTSPHYFFGFISLTPNNFQSISGLRNSAYFSKQAHFSLLPWKPVFPCLEIGEQNRLGYRNYLFLFMMQSRSRSIDHHVKFARFRSIKHGFLDLLQFADLGSDNFEFCEIWKNWIFIFFTFWSLHDLWMFQIFSAFVLRSCILIWYACVDLPFSSQLS